ncbi:hypothetical protein C8F04DRAFT_1180588 [Mycena alexandri]|uniref:Uncharacterized protein n=1 Tax=Mycena alexandri TaxID=1745969 RepID=A0AAD6X6R5_9AGAR|nr:hypothetical protein C8F04DRAFT_1180588 [Mycena alexandri]
MAATSQTTSPQGRSTSLPPHTVDLPGKMGFLNPHTPAALANVYLDGVWDNFSFALTLGDQRSPTSFFWRCPSCCARLDCSVGTLQLELRWIQHTAKRDRPVKAGVPIIRTKLDFNRGYNYWINTRRRRRAIDRREEW